ncbi:MAG: metallophosphoesterase family protein [Planctomycetes bacterium]|nr:metallophosphoesterase family protein [Planctomycetota bacterium]MCB9869651.1 metallophosphoesterase family protein [Planctomycetota bacterium]
MTEFAIISDLHSNLPALEAVFRRIDELGLGEVLCLGDVVGYCAEPEPCVRLVMRRCKWTLMGNHDWGLFHDTSEFNPLASEALVYNRKLLKPTLFRPGRRAPWRYLEGLPDRMADHGYLFFHGSPRNPIMEYVLRSDEHFDPEKLDEIFRLIDRPTFVGHTHHPGITRADRHFTPATDDNRVFDLDEPCVVNVGSVGQPRDGDARACFAVVADGKVEILRVPYDYHRTQAKILAAGLHPALADRLGRGK